MRYVSESSFENLQINGTAIESLFRDHPEMAESFAQNYDAWADSVRRYGPELPSRLLGALEYISYKEISEQHIPWMASQVDVAVANSQTPLIVIKDMTPVTERVGSLYFYSSSVADRRPRVRLVDFVDDLPQLNTSLNPSRKYNLFIFDDIIGTGIQMDGTLDRLRQLAQAGRLPRNVEVTVAVIRKTAQSSEMLKGSIIELAKLGIRVNILSAGVAKTFGEVLPDLVPLLNDGPATDTWISSFARYHTFTLFGNSCPASMSDVYTRDPALFKIENFVKWVPRE